MRAAILIALTVAMAGPALGQEPVGCDKFRWPLDKERATLNGTDLPTLTSGASVKWTIPFAAIVALRPLADAKLPMPPERTPKSADTFAGFLQVPAPPRPGTYKITLSAEAWIDVVQGGRPLKSSAFSGAKGCEGIRKSVKFDLPAAPFAVQISGVAANEIRMVISSD